MYLIHVHVLVPIIAITRESHDLPCMPQHKSIEPHSFLLLTISKCPGVERGTWAGLAPPSPLLQGCRKSSTTEGRRGHAILHRSTGKSHRHLNSQSHTRCTEGRAGRQVGRQLLWLFFDRLFTFLSGSLARSSPLSHLVTALTAALN
jgi:hypothetical protein